MGDRPLRSPTHHSLGGPSPRLPANGTHARPRPPRLYPREDAPPRGHGALPGVSTGYAPDGGWLHTRYAPVRHSRGPEGPLPFDLHVLGLPLAFILSQDQTLHCTIDLSFFFPVFRARRVRSFFAVFPHRREPRGPGWLYLLAGLKLSKNRKLPNFQSPLPSFAGAKVRLFPLPPTLFSSFFSNIPFYVGYQSVADCTFVRFR